ncbi:hypothetical protein SK854_39105 [Lentzea sp. BCCO 10_0061]|uniref:Uncharacterized protein n=1 Tax=Lentzea sokolovensis TaxID=3095429 RepID=A0ABU4V8Q4_9PSEU|nr:hypothetical protein [Lentzea sp. BCCO 10_0061]MDX8148176.1 hypothetical protein [Lentzea sp. BCCO 10_0061]
MKIRVVAKQKAPLLVVFEPLGEEYVVPPGEHIVVEWLGDGEGEIAVHDDHVKLWDPIRGSKRVWTAEGDELLS